MFDLEVHAIERVGIYLAVDLEDDVLERATTAASLG